MKTQSKSYLIEFLGKNGPASPAVLADALKITPQALHRHLKALLAVGVIEKLGSAPSVQYMLCEKSIFHLPIQEKFGHIRDILAIHPDIVLATLFGSQARGDAKERSDIDVLVWLQPQSSCRRQDIWLFWDRHARLLPWAAKVSLIIKTWSSDMSIDTLLLDLPEEHRVIYDRAHYFATLRDAVLRWRTEWGSIKIPAFGGKHSWRYSTRVEKLSAINFKLELRDVA